MFFDRLLCLAHFQPCKFIFSAFLVHESYRILHFKHVNGGEFKQRTNNTVFGDLNCTSTNSSEFFKLNYTNVALGPVVASSNSA